MLRSMTVTNHLGESLTIELENPKSSGFQVAGIDGLGPPKADIFMTSIAAYDGSTFNSSRVDSRNIVIRLVYFGDNIEELRHKSYTFFPTRRNVTLRFKNDTREVEIAGYVESNEVAIFSKMEGSVISIVCPEPWFLSTKTSDTEQTFSNVESSFEFEYYTTEAGIQKFEIKPYGGDPVSDELGEYRYIELSTMSPINSGTIRYDGDMEVGITIRLKILGSCGDLVIYNGSTIERMIVSTSIIGRITGNQLKAGDELFITTMQGRKTARLLRNGKYSNVIAAINKTSNWFKLTRGDNLFIVTSNSGAGNVEMSVANQTLYEGI